MNGSLISNKGMIDNVGGVLKKIRDGGYWIHDNIMHFAMKEGGGESFPMTRYLIPWKRPFQLLTPVLSKGEHTIVINAFDSEGNVGSGKVVVMVE